MQLGLIGLGKMGKNMRERIRRAGIEVVGYDRNPEVSDVASLEELVQRLAARCEQYARSITGEVNPRHSQMITAATLRALAAENARLRTALAETTRRRDAWREKAAGLCGRTTWPAGSPAR